MKRSIVILFVCLLCFAGTPTPAECSGGIDLMSRAVSDLTEVLGYTAAEAEAFVFEKRGDGSVCFWHPDHPDWVYSVFIDRKTGQVSGLVPFDTGYARYRGENTVRHLLRVIRDKGYFTHWDMETHGELLTLMEKENIRPATEMLFAESAGSAVHGFFESCYGPESGWPEALCGLYRSVMEECGLTREAEPFHHPGIRVSVRREATGALRTVTLFEEEIPEEWQTVLADSNLEGWHCQSGAVRAFDWSRSGRETPSMISGSGLAAFEKDGRRLLVQLSAVDDEWRVFPLGENALYRDGDYRVTYDGLHQSLAVEYLFDGGGRTVFYLSPGADAQGAWCPIGACETLDPVSGEYLWIPVGSGEPATWKHENTPAGPEGADFRVRFPSQLGLVPIESFPTSPEEARLCDYPGLPEGYALVDGVNFRTGTSSRSRSYGMLEPGVMIPVLEVLPGDPNAWIHTRIGTLEGYVAANYTSLGTRTPSLVRPQTVARAKKEITLKNGTGLFAAPAGSFPAGTVMHVVFADGDWLYVDVPRGEMTWLMDPEGRFGYVGRDEVTLAFSLCRLEWMDD